MLNTPPRNIVEYPDPRWLVLGHAPGHQMIGTGAVLPRMQREAGCCRYVPRVLAISAPGSGGMFGTPCFNVNVTVADHHVQFMLLR